MFTAKTILFLHNFFINEPVDFVLFIEWQAYCANNGLDNTLHDESIILNFEEVLIHSFNSMNYADDPAAFNLVFRTIHAALNWSYIQYPGFTFRDGLLDMYDGYLNYLDVQGYYFPPRRLLAIELCQWLEQGCLLYLNLL